ncbi:MAG: hypothetical protein IAX21_09630 [Candidatus Bathyarchaeota archaeon]|nr:hypothetical protein [Candidatus Bathyarchaeum tardum]WNZ28891.1 MAG: hypothetical protein IAX21_09630 [Candidatus Bathyarchaeota archaeon]
MKKTVLILTLVLALSLSLNAALYFFITEKDSNISSLERKIESITDKFEALTNDFQVLNSTFQEYKNNHSHSNIEYDELTSSYEQLTETYENYVSNHTFSNSQYTTLQNQATSLQNQLDELNQNYQDLIEDYDKLLADYRLINGPVSEFDTIDDFEIELYVNKTIYSYTDPIFGNLSVYYTNGTAFQGSFFLAIFYEGGGASSSGMFEVNGDGEFIVEPPYSFNSGPGDYTIHIGQLLNVDGYSVAVWDELQLIVVRVEAK